MVRTFAYPAPLPLPAAFHGFPQKTISVPLPSVAISPSRAKFDDRGNERAKVLSLRRRMRVSNARLLLRARLRLYYTRFCTGDRR